MARNLFTVRLVAMSKVEEFLKARPLPRSFIKFNGTVEATVFLYVEPSEKRYVYWKRDYRLPTHSCFWYDNQRIIDRNIYMYAWNFHNHFLSLLKDGPINSKQVHAVFKGEPPYRLTKFTIVAGTPDGMKKMIITEDMERPGVDEKHYYLKTPKGPKFPEPYHSLEARTQKELKRRLRERILFEEAWIKQYDEECEKILEILHGDTIWLDSTGIVKKRRKKK